MYRKGEVRGRKKEDTIGSALELENFGLEKDEYAPIRGGPHKITKKKTLKRAEKVLSYSFFTIHASNPPVTPTYTVPSGPIAIPA